jgi:hypothetical protein
MTTVREIVIDALLEISIIDGVTEAPAEQAEHARRVLNRLLGTWSQRRLLRPSLLQVTVPMTGAASYTIGPTGAVVASRPLKLISAWRVDAGGYKLPVRVLSEAQWMGGGATVSGGSVCGVWYQPTNTNGTLWVDAIESGGSLILSCHALITSYSSLNDVIALPDGYESLFLYGLADALCNSYEKPVPADVQRHLSAAMRAVRSANHEPLTLRTDVDGTAQFQIERGY